MTFRLGLTGSIGMGKSTTAAMFADEGVPVWDADATVHRLYAPGGAAATALAHLLPGVAEPDGGISRARLRDMIRNDANILDQLNAVVHPLAAANRADFLAKTTADIALLDIPLLFETGAEAGCDAVVVVTAASDVQRARVLARSEMTAADLDMILARQMPDTEKRARADYIIETISLDVARAAVRAILVDIRRKLADA